MVVDMRTVTKRFTHTISGSGAGTGIVAPSNQLVGDVTGALVGVDARLSVGAAVTSVQVYAWDGQEEDGATVPAERVCFDSAAITSGLTASATTGILHQVFDYPWPFSDGLTPAVTVAATGDWTLEVTLFVELTG